MENLIGIKTKYISVIGSTGSVGVSTLDVVERSGGRFKVIALSCGKNLDLLLKQIHIHRPQIVSVATKELANELEKILDSDIKKTLKILHGKEGCIEVATYPQSDIIVSAMSGVIGLIPTYHALLAGKDVALANKESLVTAGKILKEIAHEKNASIIPVDSEHNAIFQCLQGKDKDYLNKIILTASGGPFLKHSIDDLRYIGVKEAINHPNWRMGKKISVDSATMMNKGLEFIEAMRLFDLTPEKIEILIHPQSVVHSLVSFIDGSHLAHLGISDMRIPISYALSYPERIPLNLERFDLTQIGSLTFFKPDLEKFPCLRLALDVAKIDKNAPIILNAANEVAVEFFLQEKIRFLDIPEIVEKTLNNVNIEDINTIDDVMHWDAMARLYATNLIYDRFLA